MDAQIKLRAEIFTGLLNKLGDTNKRLAGIPVSRFYLKKICFGRTMQLCLSNNQTKSPIL